ncbi:MAG: aspartate kinase, partial [Planctomycetota bacterium]
MIVAKFGGTSLGAAKRIKRCAQIVRRLAEKEKVVVVASAIAGVTDAILQAAYDALHSCADITPLIDLHHRVAKQMCVDFSPLERIIARLQLLLRCVEILRVLPAAVLDEMLSVGERLSVRVVAAALRQHNLPAEPLDAPDAGFLTDDNHTAAKPLPQAIPRLAKSLKWGGTIKVVTGFIGRTREGRITTIGRNGSDLTAAIVAAALNAKELRIFTDTPGVLSADPRLVADATPVRCLSYEEAAELARFGATVLHPQTIIPLIQQKIPVRVASSAQPDDPGTLVLPEAKGTRPV